MAGGGGGSFFGEDVQIFCCGSDFENGLCGVTYTEMRARRVRRQGVCCWV